MLRSIVQPNINQEARTVDKQELVAFSTLIDSIYQGATELSAWADIPRAIAHWMRSPLATLFTPLHTPEQGGFIRTHNLDAQAIELWATKFHAQDPWAQRALSSGRNQTGVVFRDQDLMTEADLLLTPFYQDFLHRLGVGRLASGVVFGLDTDPATADMPVACSCNRELPRPYQEEDMFRMSLLLPHLSRALGVMFRLRRADFRLDCSLAALDLMPQAVVLLESDGTVSHANPMAQNIFAQSDGLILATRPGNFGRGVLRCTTPADQKELDVALASALKPDALHATHFSTAVRVRRPSNAPTLAVQVSSLAPGNEFGRGLGQTPMAIAFIKDGRSDPQPDIGLLRAQYDLTPAEARVAEASGHGLSIAEMSELLQIGIPTVKTHLARIYAKTGTSGRAQLMKLLATATTHR